MKPLSSIRAVHVLQECTNTPGSYECSCNEGFLQEGKHDCGDVDECDEDNFGCSDVCVNTFGGAYCSCPVGYSLMQDNRTCEGVLISCVLRRFYIFVKNVILGLFSLYVEILMNC